MAWNVRWKIPFARRRGDVIYTINIYDEDFTGTAETLLGGAVPFETQEESDDNIFLAVRSQSGYVRIEDTSGGTLMEEMIPANNTQRMVRLMKGDNVMWQGFLCSQAYSQPWTKRSRLLEFPVKSFLGALDDLRFTSKNMGVDIFLYQILGGISELTGGEALYSSIIGINDHNGNPLDFLADLSVSTNSFFTKDTIRNEGESTYEYVGESYSDVFTGLLSPFGLVVREEGNTLYFAQYDHPETTLKKATSSWDNLFGNIIAPELWNLSDVEEPAVLDSIEVAGNESTAGYMQGGSVAIVDLQLSSQDMAIELPPVAQTSDEPIAVDLEDGGEKLFVQPHKPLDTDLITYSFFEYNPIDLLNASDYDTVVQKSVLFNYWHKPYPDGKGSSDEHLYTGAFPVRFNTRANDTDLVELKDGLYFNAQISYFAGAMQKVIYRQASGISFNMRDGYLCFAASCLNVIARYASDGYYTEAQTMYINFRMRVRICIGGKLWWNDDKKEWVSEETEFIIHFVGGSVKTNKTKEIMVDASSGYFIPVSGQQGQVTLEIIDNGQTTDTPAESEFLCYTHILYDMKLSYMAKENMVTSSTDENIYRQVIQTKGFSEEKKIDLDFGTLNNNDDNPCFFRKSDSYLQTMAFRTNSGTLTLRPEIRLVNRLADYYSEVRRTFTVIVDDGISLAGRIFTYNGRKYMAIDGSHDWRAGKMTVKFIEV